MGLIEVRKPQATGRSALSILVWPIVVALLWLMTVVMPVFFHVFLDHSQAP